MTHKNVLILLSDEHNADIMGCAGHPLVKTPHLDALAARGTRFTSAYTSSPICVPARASLATGRYVHQHRCWDNAIAYTGAQPSWGHRLQAHHIPVDSIGKLHYRSEQDAAGFDHEYLAMHIMDGIGQVWGSVRDPLPETAGPSPLFDKIGPGDSRYNKYDRSVADKAVDWINARSRDHAGQPWVLFVGMVAPHFPLIVPQQYLDLYPLDSIPMPRLSPQDGYVRHPWVQRQVRFTDHDAAVGSDERKRLALACYYALVSFLDDQVGKIMAALDDSNFRANTTVIYSSDHGDNMGVRGMWNKCLLYKESTAIPMIVSGPDVPAARTCDTSASLVDLYPTITSEAGLATDPADAGLPGRSLVQLANQDDDPERFVLSEFHAIGSEAAAYMVADARYKYHEYLNHQPELFDLQADPGETRNLAPDPAYRPVLDAYGQKLRSVLDPVAVDWQAKQDQARLIDAFGGREQALKTGTPAATPVPTSAVA